MDVDGATSAVGDTLLMSTIMLFSGKEISAGEVFFHWATGLGGEGTARQANGLHDSVDNAVFWERCRIFTGAVCGCIIAPMALRDCYQSRKNGASQKRHCAAAPAVAAFDCSSCAAEFRDLLSFEAGGALPPRLVDQARALLSTLVVDPDEFIFLPDVERLSIIKAAVTQADAPWIVARDADGHYLSFQWLSGRHCRNRTRLQLNTDLTVELYAFGQLIPLPNDAPIAGRATCKVELLGLLDYIDDMQPCYCVAARQDEPALRHLLQPAYVARTVFMHPSRSSRPQTQTPQPDLADEGCLPEERLAAPGCTGLISGYRTIFRCPACHQDARRLRAALSQSAAVPDTSGASLLSGRTVNRSPDGSSTVLQGVRGTFSPVLNGASAPALNSAFVPAFNGALVPTLNGASAPAFNGAFVPAFNGAFVPAFNGAFVPALNGASASALNIAFVPALNGAFAPALNGPFAPALNGAFGGSLSQLGLPAAEFQQVQQLSAQQKHWLVLAHQQQAQLLQQELQVFAQRQSCVAEQQAERERAMQQQAGRKRAAKRQAEQKRAKRAAMRLAEQKQTAKRLQEQKETARRLAEQKRAERAAMRQHETEQE